MKTIRSYNLTGDAVDVLRIIIFQTGWNKSKVVNEAVTRMPYCPRGKYKHFADRSTYSLPIKTVELIDKLADDTDIRVSDVVNHALILLFKYFEENGYE